MRRSRRFVSVLAAIGLVPVVALPLAGTVGAVEVPVASLGAPVTESFDSLASSGTTNTALPTGWYVAESGTNANGEYRAGTGSDNTGDTYSFGSTSSPERALGSLRSGSLVSSYGVQLRNATGATITSLDVAYTIEQWRLGQNTAGRAPDRLAFEYSVDATSLTTGTWTAVTALDGSSPVVTGTVGLLDGNAAANRASVSGSIGGLSVASSGTVWLRWSDTDLAPGADDGLGIDDVSITAGGEVAPTLVPVLNEFVANHVGTDTNEYVEVYGSPSTDYSDYAILQIEGDSGTASGVIDTVLPVGSTTATGHWSTGFLNSALENGTMTLLLVRSFTGTVGTDLDVDDNGIVETIPWAELVDAVAVTDGGAGDRTYGFPALAPSFGGGSNTVGGASRIPDGVDTDGAADWVRNDFDLAGVVGFPGSPADGEALNTPGAPNALVEVEPEPEITRIHAIQGSGDAAAPGTFTIDAIVVGDYQTQGSGQLRGFFVQEEDADVDADAATSEGIFVFCSTCPTAVAVGDLVRVTGNTSEFFGMSQLNATTPESVEVLSSANPLPSSASLELPVPGVPNDDLTAATAAINSYFERSEGMLVTFPDTLSVAEYFELARYGQVILTEGGRPHTFTATQTPSAAGLVAHEIDLARRSVILDDTDNRQNRPVDSPNTAYFHPVPGLSTSNFFRGGDTITDLTGVLHWSFAGQSGTDAWRIRPVTEAFDYSFTPANPRPAMPEVDGDVTVASFNVLNYFLSIDTANTCSPTLAADCRGADSVEELERQRTKLLAALNSIDADVFGFMEMENTPGVEPLADLVAGLPGYAYVDTGAIGTDAIRVGFIYRTSTVALVGDHAVLDSQAFVNPRNAPVDRNRPAVAQTFEEVASGGRFTVVVNHLKSKGSGCGVGDDDTTTGQGNCNLTRTLSAQALAEWLATDPTGSGDPDVLIIGDLNAYAKEDPIVALQDAGYTDLVAEFGGPSAYGYVFDGQLGYLDHALANDAMRSQVVDVQEWHINADEIPLFDYNDDVRTADEAAFEEESDVLPLFSPDAYRTSDHDPVIVGLELNAAPQVDAGGPYQVVESGTVTLDATANDPDDDEIAFDWDLDGDGTFETPGQSVEFDAAGLTAPTTVTVTVRATDADGLTATDTATVSVVYPFGGFRPPVSGPPSVNPVKAGSAVPVAFSLGGARGLDVFADGTPTVEIGPCPWSPIGTSVESVSIIGAGLIYTPGNQQYRFVWKTSSDWKGQCGRLVLTFDDGTSHTALFTFR